MLTISDLGRGMAKLLFEFPDNVRQGVVAGIDLIEREILAVGRIATGSLVHAVYAARQQPRRNCARDAAGRVYGPRG
jgi:hypothetical protein